MTRLIDADKLIDDLSDLKRSPWANTPYASDQRKLGIIEALDMVQSIVRVDSQTVEAIPIEWIKEYIELQESYDTEIGDIFGVGAREMLRYCAERKEE